MSRPSDEEMLRTLAPMVDAYRKVISFQRSGWFIDKGDLAECSALYARLSTQTPADAQDGWQNWSGYQAPAEADEMVRVRFRDGTEEVDACRCWDWEVWGARDHDIVAYRVELAAPASKPGDAT